MLYSSNNWTAYMAMVGQEAVLISKILGNPDPSEERCTAVMEAIWTTVQQLPHLSQINMELDSPMSIATLWMQAMIEVARQLTEDRITPEPLRYQLGRIMVPWTTSEALITRWMAENEWTAWMEAIIISTQTSKKARIPGTQLSMGQIISTNSTWTGKEETQDTWSVHPWIK